jgi:hypothetical protein
MSEVTKETIEKVYAEIEKIAGDIDSLRTVLVTLFAATLTGLSDEKVEEQLIRIAELVDNNRKPPEEIKPNGAQERK